MTARSTLTGCKIPSCGLGHGDQTGSNPDGERSIRSTRATSLYRLMARSPPSQGGNPGSNPGRDMGLHRRRVLAVVPLTNCHNGESSNGRMRGSDPRHEGSNPSTPTYWVTTNGSPAIEKALFWRAFLWDIRILIGTINWSESDECLQISLLALRCS